MIGKVGRRAFLMGAGVLGLGAASGFTPAAPFCAGPHAQMRAVWISTVSNIDWPNRSGLGVEEQKQQYRGILDDAVRLRLNTVIVQVRPAADALWPSPHEPWSRWLTGTQGRDPGYDPLAFLVEETHARGLALHAWFNPYRVTANGDASTLVEGHPARRHPDWVLSYGGRLFYDPGLPAVRDFVITAVMDAVQRYAIDGVVFDDYFYPYPIADTPIPDGATFAAHGNGIGDIGDWRRDNVNQLVRGMKERIHAAKPDVVFGISPFGIWRNKGQDERGSATTGLASFSAIYADSLTWVKQGWVDYIAPQIYWEIGNAAADYATLVPWWAGAVAGTDVRLYIGQAAYKVGSSPAWDDGQLAAHLALNRAHPEVRGDMYFSVKSLRTNASGAMARVVDEHYRDCS